MRSEGARQGSQVWSKALQVESVLETQGWCRELCELNTTPSHPATVRVSAVKLLLYLAFKQHHCSCVTTHPLSLPACGRAVLALVALVEALDQHTAKAQLRAEKLQSSCTLL